MRSLVWSPAWWLLLSGLAGPAIAADEQLSGPVPGEMEAFKASLARFEERVVEMRAEAARMVQAQKAAHVAATRSAYDDRLAELETGRRDERAQAITRLEGFLQRYDANSYGSEVRLRLAELYFQRSNEAWLAESTRYFTALAEATNLDDIAALEERGEPRLDLSSVIALLDRVIADNRDKPIAEQYALLDVAYYMLAFCYSEQNSAQFERTKARDTFAELVKVRPSSEYADAAHLVLGNYYFDDNRFKDSIVEFQAVIDRGPEEKHYPAALYQMAWARYKLSDYDSAMTLFVQLLDASELRKARGERASEFEKDGIDYLALSLSDQADQRSQSPLERATAYFGALGSPRRAYEWPVLRSLAESLVRYDRRMEAVEIYSYLQTRDDFRLRPENPDFQVEVVRLLSRGYDADLKAAGEARIQMAARYGEGTAWFNANRDNPEAVAKAQRYIETSLLEVAIEVKVRAQEAKDPALYGLAADKYREYLLKFPISDDYFLNQYQLADALYQSGRYAEASVEWSDLLRNERFHPNGDVAAYMLFRTRDQLLRDKVGPPDVRYAAAEVERTYASVGGEEVTVYHLDDAQKVFIEAADAVLARRFGEPVDGLDIGAIVEQNRVKVMYLSAQILYYANRYEEARPRLQAIFQQHPATDEAAWAANLMLNTYIAEKDSAEIRRWSREFATMRLGASSQVVESRAQQFQDTLEKATFEVGVQAAKAGDYEGAATAYLSFVDEFPKSPNVPVALLNAAGNYDRLGRAADANGIYERFIQEFPTHPEAKPYFFIIASNYESTYELSKAIAIYQELVDRYPDYERSPDAAYMVAFLKEGLGDSAGAAAGYEAYGRTYPSASDREDVVFRAGALYEELDPEKAIKFYRSYLGTFGTTNPDHALLAQYRIAEIHKRQGRTKESATALAEVVSLFDRVVDAGKPVGPAGRDQAAAAAFGALKQRHDRIVGYELTRNEAKDAKLLTETMRDEVNQLSTAAGAYAERYRSFTWSTAALYLVGSAQAAYARLGLSVEPPAGLDETDQVAYWELLETTLFPLFYQVEEQAVGTFESVLKLARDTGRHSEWVDQARAALGRLRPDDFPAGKLTLPGKLDVVPPAKLAPVTAGEVSPAPPAPPAGGAP